MLPFIFFIADTYEEKIPASERSADNTRNSDNPNAVNIVHNVPEEGLEEVDEEEVVLRTGAKRRRGRRPNQRSRYLSPHPKWNTHQRVIRSPGHNTIPKTIGQFYPTHDDPDNVDFFYASMLSLCKPWRNLKDLKSVDESWEEAYNNFLTTAPKRVHHIISGIKYHYECRRSAKERRQTDADGQEEQPRRRRRNEFEDVVEDDEGETDDDASDSDFEEEQLALALDEMKNSREEVHGKAALEIARSCGIFKDSDASWTSEGRQAGAATGDDLLKLAQWENALQESLVPVSASESVDRVIDEGSVSMDTGERERVEHIAPELLGVGEEELSAVDASCLFPEQRRAYDIVEWHLEQTLAGREPPQLLMHVPGEGGVGKSKVIQTITEKFKSVGAGDKLVKAAYTGIAASLIGGSTLHVITRMPLRDNTKQSPETDKQLAEYWSTKTHLIIDEVSMVHRKMLARISRIISKARAHLPNHSTTKPFGGLNVIIFGDLHQFPPVSGGASSALFVPILHSDIGDKKKEDAVAGREIYDQFVTVVKLRKQVRVVDERWRLMLQHARHGNCGPDDLSYLRSLIITNQDCPETDFSDVPWSEAILITPRHAVRRQWNTACVLQHCKKEKKKLYISKAEDTVKGRTLTAGERLALMKKKQVVLPSEVHLAIGCKVMVTFNVETQLDIANGSRGTIYDIVLDEREPVCNDEVVHLKYPPAYVLVKLDRTKAPKLDGLPEGVVPIVPMTKDISITYNGRQIRVRRTQLPITLAYAFTDYRGQGQTINYVIVDIGWPPSGGLTPFNAYVALSRSSGAQTIRLLRDFESSLFTKHPSEFLRNEDRRLERLDKETKIRWTAFLEKSVTYTYYCMIATYIVP